MKTSTIFLILFLSLSSLYGQVGSQSKLFAPQEPLALKLDFSFKELRKNTNDSTYLDKVLYYKTGDDWNSINVKLRKRGHFRLDECFFPPVKIRIKKKERKGTIFEDEKNLKLVLPCKKTKDANSLIIREYMVYKIYEYVTPYSFSTRLTPIEVIDEGKKNDPSYNALAFLIEDDKRVAKRNKAKVKEESVMHPLRLHDTTAVRHAIFQYFIANMDWSTVYQHNCKIIRTENPNRNIPLAYDFDQAGFVDASYAVLNPEFESATVNPDFVREDVKDRIYRGFCRNNDELMYYVRDEFIELESKVYEIMEKHKSYLPEREYKGLVKFVDKFYAVLENERWFNKLIVEACRTK